MQTQIFKIKWIYRVLIYILYLPICGLFLFLIGSPWILENDIVAGDFFHLLFIVIGVLMMALFTGAFYDAYYGYLKIDDTEIQLHSFLYKRNLLHNEIQGFKISDKYITIYPLKNISKKKIPISRYIEKESLFIDLLYEHFDDLNALEMASQLEHIAQNEAFGDTPETRLRNLERYTQIITYYNYFSIAVAIWTIYFSFPYHMLMYACMALPLIHLIVSKILKNKILFDLPQNHALPSIGLATTMYVMALLIRVISDFNLFFYTTLFIHSAILGVLLSIYYYFNRNHWNIHWSYAIYSMVLLFIYSFGLNVSINCLWDQSKPVAQQTKIINMHQSNGKHTSYYIDISLPPDTIELSVSSATYQRYKTSDSITYHINKGYLQTPWISIYEK